MNVFWLVIAIAIVIAGISYFMSGRSTITTAGTVYKDEFSTMVDRVNRYRGVGSSEDGIHMLWAEEIDDVDWALMGADTSSAKANHPNVAMDNLMRSSQYHLKQGSELSRKSFLNSHGSFDEKRQEWYTEVAMLAIPDPQYQAPAEEVVWHRKRVDELIAQNVPKEERMRMMTAERKSKPWEQRKY